MTTSQETPAHPTNQPSTDSAHWPVLILLGSLVVLLALALPKDANSPEVRARAAVAATQRADAAVQRVLAATVQQAEQAAALEASSVQVGRWQWTSFLTSAESYPPVQVWLDVAEGGALKGLVSVYPNSTLIPQSALTLIQQNGCNVPLEAWPGDAVISGKFISSTQAIVRVNITECTVKFYGPLVLEAPLSGTFLVDFDPVLTESLIRAATTPLTPLEVGRNVFGRTCSACHGTYGQGAPGIPSLDTEQVRGYSDEALLKIIREGVANATMPAWGGVLSDAEIDGVMQLVRQVYLLRG